MILVCRFPLTPFYSFSRVGGDERDRTDDPLLAKQVLSQLSYTPKYLRSGQPLINQYSCPCQYLNRKERAAEGRIGDWGEVVTR